MKYKILYADRIDELEKLVNGMVSQYWKPQGGPFIGRLGGYYQAMFKD